MALPAEDTGEIRVSIWSIHEESHARFVTACAVASLTAIVLCLGFWNWSDWRWSHLYELPKEICAAVGLSVAATWAAFNGVEAMGIALESFRKQQRLKGRAEGRAEGKAEERRRIRDFADSNGESLTRDQLLRFLDQLEDPPDADRPQGN